MYFQFLAPIFVVAYVSLSLKKWLLKYQVIGIIGTLVGLILLLTNASFDDLLVSSKALLRGERLVLRLCLHMASLIKEWSVLLVPYGGCL